MKKNTPPAPPPSRGASEFKTWLVGVLGFLSVGLAVAFLSLFFFGERWLVAAIERRDAKAAGWLLMFNPQWHQATIGGKPLLDHVLGDKYSDGFYSKEKYKLALPLIKAGAPYSHDKFGDSMLYIIVNNNSVKLTEYLHAKKQIDLNVLLCYAAAGDSLSVVKKALELLLRKVKG